MFSRLFGSKKKEDKDLQTSGAVKADFSFLGTDIHSHFIAGVDDGAQTLGDSVGLIKGMKEMGFKSIVTTPHIKFDHYPNTRETILNGLKEVHQALRENGVDMPVRAAAEYYIDDHFMRILEEEELLTIQGNELLVELSFMFEPLGLNEIMFKIQTKGYQPILAHPERYSFFHQKTEVFKQLKDRGVMLQLNTIALTGYYGKSVKEVAEELLAKGLYDYCGSDMHHPRHAEMLNKVAGLKIFEELKRYPFRNARVTVA
ncbi:MAG: tyrosine-protein phosphatase [Flavipsychrobacter sp.]